MGYLRSVNHGFMFRMWVQWVHVIFIKLAFRLYILAKSM